MDNPSSSPSRRRGRTSRESAARGTKRSPGLTARFVRTVDRSARQTSPSLPFPPFPPPSPPPPPLLLQVLPRFFRRVPVLPLVPFPRPPLPSPALAWGWARRCAFVGLALSPEYPIPAGVFSPPPHTNPRGTLAATALLKVFCTPPSGGRHSPRRCGSFLRHNLTRSSFRPPFRSIS